MFEKLIKNLLANYEPQSPKSDWADFEVKLDEAVKKVRFAKKMKWISSASAVIVSIGVILTIYNAVHKPAEIIEIPAVKNEEVIKNTIPVESSEEITRAEKLTAYTPPASHSNTTATAHNHAHSAENSQVGSSHTQSESNQSLTETAVTNNIAPVNRNDNQQSLLFFNLQIEPSTHAVCANESIRFTPSMINNSFKYLWDFGDGSTSTEIFPVHTYRNPGTFDVKLELLRERGTEPMFSKYTVTIYPLPVAHFSYTLQQETFGYPRVSFKCESNDAAQWKWSFGDNKFSYEQHPNHTYFIHENTLADVLMTIENIYGCKAQHTTQIAFTDVFDLMAPNAFSPDGDGLNDYFIPKALEIMDLEFEMFIYDRGGHLIYNTKNKSHPWDGRVGVNGQIPDSGTFIWIVFIYDNNGKTHKYAGNVSIVK